MTNANPFDALRDELSEIIRSIVREELQVLKDRQTESPSVVQEPDRLLSLEEVAARLGCCKQLVTQRMSRGEIIWTKEAGTGDRKVKECRLNEYIQSLPEYRGRKSDAVPVHHISREEAIA